MNTLSLQQPPSTIADRYFEHQRCALDLLLRLALTSRFPKVRRMASRMTKTAVRRVVRAARDVELQRQYEHTFEAMAGAWRFGESEQDLRKVYGQRGYWTGD